MKKKNIYFNKVIVVGFVKSLLTVTMKKLEIIVALLVNLEEQSLQDQSCNLNFQLTEGTPVIFHNLKGYDSHLIFSVLHKFNLKIHVIPNGLENYMAFFLNKNLVFIDCMQFMNSSLDKLVKNLSDEDFKYLVEEFGFDNLKLLKQKDDYPD